MSGRVVYVYNIRNVTWAAYRLQLSGLTVHFYTVTPIQFNASVAIGLCNPIEFIDLFYFRTILRDMKN